MFGCVGFEFAGCILLILLVEKTDLAFRMKCQKILLWFSTLTLILSIFVAIRCNDLKIFDALFIYGKCVYDMPFLYCSAELLPKKTLKIFSSSLFKL